jgi:hypothetical protein
MHYDDANIADEFVFGELVNELVWSIVYTLIIK